MTTASFRINLHLCTWNVGVEEPNGADLGDILGFQSTKLPDIYAIALQEVCARPVPYVRSAFFDCPWTEKFKSLLSKFNYVKVKSIRLQGLLLMLFIERHHLIALRNVETTYTRTGLGGFWGNKGAVSMHFTIYGKTVCIINCHLAAHHSFVKERIEDYDMILDRHYYKNGSTERILDHDFIFWMGDLNFRIDNLEATAIIELVKENDFEKLLEHDQLLKCIAAQEGFDWFKEGEINFSPTFKFERRTRSYDASRRPAWCDRILWRAGSNLTDSTEARQLSYKSHMGYELSDHRPVTSCFALKVSSEYNMDAVIFEPIDTWKAGETQTIIYTVKEYTPTSSWDWIALYTFTFDDVYYYETYQWAVPKGEQLGLRGCSVKFPGRYLTFPAGFYCLCYMSSRFNCAIGISKPFELIGQTGIRRYPLTVQSEKPSISQQGDLPPVSPLPTDEAM